MASEAAAPFDMEYDVVVVGLGGAGASAAIEAHDAGAKVLVIEKNPEDAQWSNTRLSGGVFHCPDPTGDHDALVEYIKAMMSGENCPWKLEGEQPHVSQEMAEMFADGILHTKDFLLGPGSRPGRGAHDSRRRRLVPHVPLLRRGQVRRYQELSLPRRRRCRF